MSRTLPGRSAVFLAVVLTGCGTVAPRWSTPSPAAASRTKDLAKQLAMGPATTREPALADPSTMIPPPPNMNDLIPAIPAAPAREEYVSAALSDQPSGIVPASGIVGPGATPAVRPAVERARAVAEDPAPSAESNLDALRRLHRAAAEQFGKLSGFECRLTRRETVSNKPMPEEVLEYKFRREPYSLHIKWVGLEAQGRELVYVQGKFDNKVQILTGKCEGLLIRSGQRWSFAPTDSQVRSKSRYDIREGGMGMSIAWFGKVLGLMDKDPAQAHRIRYLGRKPVRERESGLEAIEETIPPGWEPLLPRGGKRTTHFDPDPASPSFGLPILVTAVADTGRQVEYYWFDQLRPLRPSDVDFDPERLWGK